MLLTPLNDTATPISTSAYLTKLFHTGHFVKIRRQTCEQTRALVLKGADGPVSGNGSCLQTLGNNTRSVSDGSLKGTFKTRSIPLARPPVSSSSVVHLHNMPNTSLPCSGLTDWTDGAKADELRTKFHLEQNTHVEFNQ